MEITQQINDNISKILDGEWGRVYWVPDNEDFGINLDGDFTINQLEKLTVYLKGLKVTR